MPNDDRVSHNAMGCFPLLCAVAFFALVAWAVFDFAPKSAVALGIGIALIPLAILGTIVGVLAVVAMVLVAYAKARGRK
jgi:hypothetical protein